MLGEYPIQGRRAMDISASIERAVSEGALEPGQLLPPMRELAVTLGVNPNTVAAAYRILRERGVIETQGRRGSRVRARPATTGRERAVVSVPVGVRNLASGNPDPALLPALGPAFVAATRGRAPVLYGEAPVDAELGRLARRAFDADGVPAGELVVVSGALDAVERVLGAHLKPGDSVAVEDPGWNRVLDLVAALGLRVVPVAVDDEGPVVAELRGALESGVRAVVITDRAQNPTGAAVSPGRARELRQALGEHPEVLVIEDDHGHGIVDLPLCPLGGVTRHWAFVRSVAKAYGPDLRVAVMTGDTVTVDRVRGRQRLGAGWVSLVVQRAVVWLWEHGGVDPAAVGGVYRGRREMLIDALRARGVETRGRSGLGVWIPVEDETGVVARLLREGWAVAAGGRFRVNSGPGIRVTVSTLREEETEKLAQAIAEAVKGSSDWGVV
ncbi:MULTISPECIES: aminotransferase class I/II-fold pyridoxal phosphate-dependent enzyme [unclassified Streptomyces]|uniref:aminotransferase class I/II-fold pyridoxal phosphate-dependent enzyme n=1 Tax=unclassified Streptomyces TaxID=2593676 RepID=UPI000DDAEA17|nr:MULTISPECIES: aminotransferase class I/II-fold pyridoxal phosphate-dependent enzyme [unclassified Streptomyces]QZZ26608.1 aminotransferase class I/II-fold pyridoxal phosphate-dependent enzyme [Streptomyces sp. ST1015]